MASGETQFATTHCCAIRTAISVNIYMYFLESEIIHKRMYVPTVVNNYSVDTPQAYVNQAS